MARIHLRIDDTLDRRLEALCQHHGVKSFLIRTFIEDGVKRLEQQKALRDKILPKEPKA